MLLHGELLLTFWIRPAMDLIGFCAWDSSPHLPVTPAQLMRADMYWLKYIQWLCITSVGLPLGRCGSFIYTNWFMHYVTSCEDQWLCIKVDLVRPASQLDLNLLKLLPSQELITVNQCQQMELKVCKITKTTAACRWCSIKKSIVENEIYNCITFQVTSETLYYDGMAVVGRRCHS